MASLGHEPIGKRSELSKISELSFGFRLPKDPLPSHDALSVPRQRQEHPTAPCDCA